MNIQGHTALVTGAGHRVGKAIALALAGAGADVVVHYGGSERAAQETADEIRALGRQAWTLQADLGDPQQIASLFTQLDQGAGALDIVVNSAASFHRTPLTEIPLAEWDAVMAINLRAPFLCLQHAVPRIRARAGERGGAGSVVNIVDLAGLYPWRGFAHHGVSKAGLAHLTRIAAAELGPHLRVNAIAPGAVLPPPGMTADGAAWRQVGERLPVGHTGDPARIGETVVFLSTNDFITGEVLRVDGGEHLFAGHNR
jgi:pteridine reductase